MFEYKKYFIANNFIGKLIIRRWIHFNNQRIDFNITKKKQ